MTFARFLLRANLLLLPVAIVATTWLYLYPIFHFCTFPTPTRTDDNASSPLPATAPFRLLALGDPQLEGDSSLPNPNDPVFPSLDSLLTTLREQNSVSDRYDSLRNALRDLVEKDIPKLVKAKRKELDLWGNDYYLAHIYRTIHWWTEPTHVSVLGDLLGSQWVSDGEFFKRGDRFWGRVFNGAEIVPEEIMRGHIQEGKEETSDKGPWVEVLGQDEAWTRRIINIAGNHDVGYAGDLNEDRLGRFEKVFGKVNWDIIFTLPNTTRANPVDEQKGEDEVEQNETEYQPPALRLVILNSMNLDTNAQSPELQSETYEFLNSVISRSRPVEDRTISTILLTHIPLHKESGVCVDDPFFDFHSDGGVKEQNHLSDHASKGILEGIFGLNGDTLAPGGGMGRMGVVVNGHDHEGCDVLHYLLRPSSGTDSNRDIDNDEATESMEKETMEETEEPKWKARRLGVRGASVGSVSAPNAGEDINLTATPHLREITLRSMMGEFGGYAGFLSAWFDPSIGERGEWKIEFSSCSLGVQHWWWAVHVLDLVALGVLLVGVLSWVMELASAAKRGERKEKARSSYDESCKARGGPTTMKDRKRTDRKETKENSKQTRSLESMETKPRKRSER